MVLEKPYLLPCSIPCNMCDDQLQTILVTKYDAKASSPTSCHITSLSPSYNPLLHPLAILHPCFKSSTPKSIEPSERIPDKRQAHLRLVFFSQSLHLRPMLCGMIALINLIDWEIANIHRGGQSRFKRSANPSQ